MLYDLFMDFYNDMYGDPYALGDEYEEPVDKSMKYKEWASLYEEGRHVPFIYRHVKSYASKAVKSKKPPEHVIKVLDGLIAYFGDEDDCQTVRDMKFDFLLEKNLPLPLNYDPTDYEYALALTDILTPPISGLTFGMIVRLTNRNYFEITDEPDDTTVALFNAGLKTIDDRLRSTTGKGILETYGRGFTKKLHCLSDGKHLTVKYMDIRPGDDITELFQGLYRFCRKHLGHKTSVPSNFKKEYRQAVRETEPFRNMPGSGGKGVVAKPYTEGDFDGPVYFEHYVSDRKPDVTQGDFEIHYYEEHGPCGYVPSLVKRACYSHFTEEQLNYYLYWRSEARKGSFHDTDRGYMWLFLSELINTELDARTVKRIINGIERNYMRFEETDDLLKTTVLQFQLMNGFPTMRPDDDIVNGSIDNYLKQYIEGTISAPMDFRTLKAVAKKLRVPLYSELDEDGMGIMDLYLRNYIESIRESSIDVLRHFDMLYIEWLQVNYTRIYTSKNENVTLKTNYPYRTHNLYKMFYTGIHDIPGLIGEYRKQGKIVKVDTETDREREILYESATTWFKEREELARACRVSNISFDEKAIADAENDLEEVTRIITATDDVEPGWGPEDVPEIDDSPMEEERPIGQSENDSPWYDFISALSQEQRGYLKKAMAGTRPDHRMEDGINSVAMDTVGDVVVDCGNIVEDYLEDLGKVLE